MYGLAYRICAIMGEDMERENKIKGEHQYAGVRYAASHCQPAVQIRHWLIFQGGI